MLILAILAISAAALRLASLVSPLGLERTLTAIVVGVSTIVIETLALGWVGLGSNRLLLATAAALTCGAAIWLLPAPDNGVLFELSHWWRNLKVAARLLGALLMGIVTAWLIWQFRHPAIGFDSAMYHYVEVSGWLYNGRPGSIQHVGYDFPFGNYPLTDEVALTWAAGISRGFGPLALWNPALLLVMAAGSWQTLRNLGVPRYAAGLATAVLVTLPLAVKELNEPQTDLPALAWLTCVAALSTGARRRPALLPPALLAAGLAVGTRPTPALLVTASLGVGFYMARASLRVIARWLAIASLGAIAVGGLWYLRNFVEHGSPLWPFVATPWGDETPRFLRLVGTSFVDRPSATLRAPGVNYGGNMAGGVIVLAGAVVLLPLGLLGVKLRRSLRLELVAAAGVALVAVVAWSFAPGTGLSRAPGLLAPVAYPISTLRYMLPALAAATVAVGLACRAGGVTGATATAALAAAAVLNLFKDGQLGFPFVPSARVVIVGGAVGVLVMVVASAAHRRFRPWASIHRRASAAAMLVVVILAGAALASASEGFVSRHARVIQTSPTRVGQQLVVSWFTARPTFARSRTTIAFASRVILGPLTGDHFTHRLLLIPAGASCEDVQALADHDVVVVTDPVYLRGLFAGNSTYRTNTCLTSRSPAYRDDIFTVYWPTTMHP